MYRSPRMSADAKIEVESCIDVFLQDHFVQYALYFDQRIEKEGQGTLVTFAGLREDDQYDDLTILGIRKG